MLHVHLKKHLLKKKLGKAITSNSENQDNKTEKSKELSAEDEIKTDKNPKKINQEVHLLNENDKSKETKASTEKNKTLDSDTTG